MANTGIRTRLSHLRQQVNTYASPGWRASGSDKLRHVAHKVHQAARFPQFDDLKQRRRAQSLALFLITTPLLVTIIGFLIIPPSDNPFAALLIVVMIDGLAAFGLVSLYQKRLNTAAGSYLFSIWLAITLGAILLNGGLNGLVVEAYLIVIIAAGLFLGMRYGIATAWLSWLAITAMYLGGTRGLIPPVTIAFTPQRIFVLQSLIFMVGLVLVYIAVRETLTALNTAEQHERDLDEKNRQLQEVLAGLEQRIAERTLEITSQKQFYEALVSNSPIAIVTLDSQHHILACNPAFEQLYGFSKEEVLGKNLDSLITTDTTWDEASNYTRRVLDGEPLKKTGQRRRKDNSLVDVEIYGVPVLVEGEQVGVLAMYQDISERVKAEEYLRHLATHDPLTVLPNRAMLYEHLNRSLLYAKRTHGRVAIFFLDLDSFKTVNDLFGHTKGDGLLQEVAERLTHSLRKSDLVARIGGDEFAFVFDTIRSSEDAALIAQKILDSLKRPFYLEGHEIFITGSIGISLYPEDGDEPRNLLRFADAAMYRVKSCGKMNYQFFSVNGKHASDD
jgi:diguanylate cyclase (GGDEF)-like protein/PAS domain S-box-containing protein